MRKLSISLTALLLAGAALHAGEKKNPATTPAPRPGGWMKTHENFVAIAKKGGVDVLFLGDSITNGWRGNGKKAWAEHIAPLKAANFGIGGDRTQHVLWRLQNGELDGISPKVAVLMIGTNNQGSDSAAQISEGIEAIVKHLRSKTPTTKVLLLAVFPRGAKADNPSRKKLAEVNRTISKLDDGKNVVYLDIGEKFLEKDGGLSKEIMYDYLHLTPRGYDIWAEAITPTLHRLLGRKQ